MCLHLAKDTLKALYLRRDDPLSEGRQMVVTAPWILLVAPVDILHQILIQKLLQVVIERSGTELVLVVGLFRDFLHDAVAMPVFTGKRDQNVQSRGRERKKSCDIAHSRNPLYRNPYDLSKCRCGVNFTIMRTKRAVRILGAFALAAVAALSLAAQTRQGGGRGNAFAGIDWNKPFPAHKIVGNMYFVGSEQLGSFLITTPEGHILINSDYEETVPVIRAALEKLGFKFTDIKILLGSHAHPDHMTGDALVKQLTGATVMAMQEDVPALNNIRPGGKPHPIDRVLHDGDTVSLGGTTLTAHLTPGHTKGCTTWTFKTTENGKTYDVVVVGSLSLNAANLGDNPGYPNIREDFVKSFKVMRSLSADVFVGSHNGFYQMAQKYARLEKGEANPFIDPAGYKALIDSSEKAYLDRIEELKNGQSR
jgi:metallo-beta-lactamase class B